MPEDVAARMVRSDPPCVIEAVQQLDLRAEGIGAVIWATGYGVDFGWIDIPVLDARGDPVHRGGVTGVPGLYFLGLQWLSKMSSSFLSGIGDDAAVLADHIVAKKTMSM
jgi:putative flavoprotein involved in K+ transport